MERWKLRVLALAMVIGFIIVELLK